jgi:hypothetical protein
LIKSGAQPQHYGAARHPKFVAIRKDFDNFASRLALIAWDEAAADHYGLIRSFLEKQGTPIGAIDMMIAAHARSLKATLVSNNSKHFEKVPGLLIANWISDSRRKIDVTHRLFENRKTVGVPICQWINAVHTEESGEGFQQPVIGEHLHRLPTSDY